MLPLPGCALHSVVLFVCVCVVILKAGLLPASLPSLLPVSYLAVSCGVLWTFPLRANKIYTTLTIISFFGKFNNNYYYYYYIK